MRSCAEMHNAARQKQGKSLAEKREFKRFFQGKMIDKKQHLSFYCDAGSPYQKGACEVNYELIRRVLPKGDSMDDLTQKDICHCLGNWDAIRLPPETSS